MKAQEFEQKIIEQININKNGIYEVFVNERDLMEYWGLKDKYKLQVMKKVFVPIFDGNIISLSYEKSRAIRNLLDEAGCETLKEFEEKFL